MWKENRENRMRDKNDREIWIQRTDLFVKNERVRETTGADLIDEFRPTDPSEVPLTTKASLTKEREFKRKDLRLHPEPMRRMIGVEIETPNLMSIRIRTEKVCPAPTRMTSGIRSANQTEERIASLDPRKRRTIGVAEEEAVAAAVVSAGTLTAGMIAILIATETNDPLIEMNEVIETLTAMIGHSKGMTEMLIAIQNEEDLLYSPEWTERITIPIGVREEITIADHH